MTDFKVKENTNPQGRDNKDTDASNVKYLLKEQKINEVVEKFGKIIDPPIGIRDLLLGILNENFDSTNWGNLGASQKDEFEQCIEKCVDCLYQLNECKISIKTSAELKQAFPNIIVVQKTQGNVGDDDQVNKENRSLLTQNSLFPPAKKTNDPIKNYENAVNAFHSESTKFACDLITSFKRDDFEQTIDHLSLVIEKVTAYQKNPTDAVKLLELVTEVQKFEKFIDNADPLWSCCRNLIGHGLILLGTIFPYLAEYGQEILKPQFMRTKDALKDLVEAASNAIVANTNNSAPTNT